MMIDLDNLTPEAVERLKGVLGMTGGLQRSPGFKPLTDMRAPSTTKGRLNRPHFEWSAEPDGNTVIPPYPRLYWDKNGKEVRVESAEQVIPSDWTAAPPIAVVLDPMSKVQAEFDALSPEDQQFVLDAQKTARLKKLEGMLSGLSKEDLATLLPKETTKAKEKRTA